MIARVAAIFFLWANTAGAASLYNLVEGLDKFSGSTPAWQLLATNGFVVTDPAFNDFYEPYLDASVPSFITVDSAWQTYRVLFEEGVKQMARRPHPVSAPGQPPSWLASGLNAAQPSGLQVFAGQSWPDSIQGDAMRLAAILQRPLPKGVPPAMRGEAWNALQRWTALGLWAGELHPPESRPRPPSGVRDDSDTPHGMVAPYPDFFSGLARLARRAETQFAQSGLEEQFDRRDVAQQFLDAVLLQENVGANPALRIEEINQQQSAQFGEFTESLNNDPAHPARLSLDDWEALARRCLNGASPAENDLRTLRLYFEHRRTVPHLLEELAEACDHLASLARKTLEGQPLTDSDQAWVGGYGALLARLNFVMVSPLPSPPDSVPIIDNILTNQSTRRVFSAALGKPEAIFVIVPEQGRLRLYRGAVMTYREWTQPADKIMDDDAWRALAATGNAPAPPAFTRAFYVEKTPQEILAAFTHPSFDSDGIEEFTRNLDELRTRVTDGDLPVLIDSLSRVPLDFPLPATEGIASAIAGLNWAPRQRELLGVLDQDGGQRAPAVIQILARHPGWLDPSYLCAHFGKASVNARRIYCALLGRMQSSPAIRETLIGALHDGEPAVRWQAAIALASPAWHGEEIAQPLRQTLNDTNLVVAAAAAYALGRSGATNSAPLLLAALTNILNAPPLSEEELQRAAEPLHDLVFVLPGQTNLLDPDGLAARLRPGLRRMRHFADPAMLQSPFEDFTPEDSIIEALGRLDYKPAAAALVPLLDGPHATAAAGALHRLEPQTLCRRLTAIAFDKNAAVLARDEAILLLALYPGSGEVNALAPLLDDATPVPGRRIMPGREWRICDRAAGTIALLLGRTARVSPMESTEQRDRDIEEVRQWLKSAY